MQSVWTDSVNFPNFDKLKKDIRTDVLIIGGGITGLLCAYQLKQAGVDYVLVEAELVGDIAFLLRNTPNVLGFLGGMDEPTPIRQSEINRILGTVDELQETPEETSLEFALGEVVKVNTGPFSGFNGTIEEINTEKKRLKVMVKIFGRSTPVDLGYLQVDKE